MYLINNTGGVYSKKKGTCHNLKGTATTYIHVTHNTVLTAETVKRYNVIAITSKPNALRHAVIKTQVPLNTSYMLYTLAKNHISRLWLYLKVMISILHCNCYQYQVELLSSLQQVLVDNSNSEYSHTCMTKAWDNVAQRLRFKYTSLFAPLTSDQNNFDTLVHVHVDMLAV